MSGCAILFPLVVTLYLTWWCLEFFDNFFRCCLPGLLTLAGALSSSPPCLRPLLHKITDRRPAIAVPCAARCTSTCLGSRSLGLGSSPPCSSSSPQVGGWPAAGKGLAVFTARSSIIIGYKKQCWARCRLLTAGVFTSSWIGTSFVGLGEYIIRKVPLVKHIYGAAKQISAAVSPDEATNSFRECVIVRHPRHGEYAFGFITGQTLLQSPTEGDIELFCVYSEFAWRLGCCPCGGSGAPTPCVGRQRAAGARVACTFWPASPDCALHPTSPMRSPYKPRLRGGHLLDERKRYHPQQPLGQGGHRCAATTAAAAQLRSLGSSGISCRLNPSYFLR